MRLEIVNNIPHISLCDFEKINNHIFLSSIDEFHKNYFDVIHSPHRISFYQLVLVDNGSGYLWIDSDKYELESKTLFTVSKGQVIRWEVEEKVKGVVIFFSDEFIYKTPGDLDWVNTLKIFDQSLKQAQTQLREPEFLEFLFLYFKMEMELKAGDDFARDGILNSFLKTFLLVAERIKRKKILDEHSGNHDANYLVQFKKKLEEHYKESRSVGFYADQMNITAKKLNKVIQSSFGVSTKKIIEERILLESKRLLVHTNQSIKEIGTELGFDYPTNFNKFFKKYTQKTPVDFRVSQKADLYY